MAPGHLGPETNASQNPVESPQRGHAKISEPGMHSWASMVLIPKSWMQKYPEPGKRSHMQGQTQKEWHRFPTKLRCMAASRTIVKHEKIPSAIPQYTAGLQPVTATSRKGAQKSTPKSKSAACRGKPCAKTDGPHLAIIFLLDNLSVATMHTEEAHKVPDQSLRCPSHRILPPARIHASLWAASA